MNANAIESVSLKRIKSNELSAVYGVVSPQFCLNLVPVTDDEPVEVEHESAEAWETERTFGDSKTAAKLRKLASNMDKKIAACFANRLENTRKRMGEAARARAEGERLTRTQKALMALADRHDNGTVPEVLLDIKTQSSVYELVGSEKEIVPNGYHSYANDTGRPALNTEKALALWALLQPKTEAHLKAEALQATIRSLTFARIPGYFPTPGSVIERMLDYIDSDEPFTVLEPSAGTGAILDAVTNKYQNVETVVYEINPTLASILVGKEYPVIQANFMHIEAAESVDYVLMNPPFENLQDVEHVQHAFKFLRPGGRLIAIMSHSGFSRQDKKAAAFRSWLEGHKWERNDLPEKSFASSGTQVNTILVIIDK